MPMLRPRKRASRSSSSVRRFCPATITVPESGRSNPVITIKSVDLPEPEGPSRATASPRPIWRSMSLSICTRAAPRPSERLTPSMLTASPANRRPEMSFIGSTGSAKVTASSHCNETPPWRQVCVRSYGLRRAFYQIIAACCALLFGAANPHLVMAENPLHVVALGDSLTAGYGLAVKDGFVPRLQAALVAQGAKVE